MPTLGGSQNIYKTRARPLAAPVAPSIDLPLTQARSLTRNRIIAASSLMLGGLALALYLATLLHRADGLRTEKVEESGFKPEKLTLRTDEFAYNGRFPLESPDSPLSLSGVNIGRVFDAEFGGDTNLVGTTSAPVSDVDRALSLPLPEDESLSSLLVSVAAKFIKAKDYDEARNVLEKALKQTPDDLSALRMMGTVLLLTEKYEESVTLFEDLVRRDPYKAEPFNHLAVACIRTGRLDRAHEALQQALKLNHSYEDARLNLGLLHLLRREFDLVPPLLDPLVNTDPTNVKLRRYLATAYWEKGDPYQARLHLQEMVRLQPDEPRPYFEIARCFTLQEQKQEALAWLSLGKEHCDATQLASFLRDPAFEPLYPLQAFQREFASFLK